MRPTKTAKSKATTTKFVADVYNAEEEKSHGQWLLQTLIDAEKQGVVRPLLIAIAKDLEKMESETVDFNSPIAKRLRSRRAVLAAYLRSFLAPFEMTLQADVVDKVILDMWMRGSKERLIQAKEQGINLEYDERAASGILKTMRNLVPAFSEIATEGNTGLASELPIHTERLVRTLNQIALEKPELLRSSASESIEWPIMATRHHPKKSDFAKLADTIGLASESPVKPQSRHNWKPETKLNRYILDMITVERWGDGRSLAKESVAYYLDEILMPLFEKVALEVGGWENYEEFAEIALSAAKRGKAGVQRSEIRNRVKKVLKSLAS